MATFRYSAMKRDGTLEKGELEAGDRSQAFRLLGRKGLQPVKLEMSEGGGVATATKEAPKAKEKKKKEAAAAAAAAAAAPAKAPPKKAEPRKPVKKKSAKDSVDEVDDGPVRLKRKEIVLFTEELSDLLAAGLQLEPALKVMESREELSGLKTVTRVLRREVRDGSSFSRSLRAASPDFGELFCSMAAAGEVSGALPTILKRQAEYLNTLQDLQSKVIFALIYPAFLVLSGIAVTVLFVTFLIPQLMTLLSSTGGSIPLGAKILIGGADFFKAWWWLLLILIVGAIVALKAFLREPARRKQWDEMILKIPLIGPILCARFYVQCMETLANLVGNGLPLLKGLELTRDTTMNLFLRDLMTKVCGIVGEGGNLSKAMKRVGFFPALLQDMVSVGEQTGDIETALQRASSRYDKELSKSIERIGAMIQPVIVFIMAGVVGTMAYLMISIIFETISGLGG
ncbi:MAG: type II secretion system F family protein [Verrucomicrobiota bacterium]